MLPLTSPLPIDAVLPEVSATLAARTTAVLVAPPGAGKTTRLPLALLDAPWLGTRKILLLEPRRIAARGAADRMAATLGDSVGGIIGMRARLGTKVSARTRIEVVTEGVFTRMILADPSLDGVAAVLFDEFHERSLDADLGLALARDCQKGLRDDLRILVMSATLDGARVAGMLDDCPVIESQGRAHAVATHYLGRGFGARVEDQMTDAVLRALRSETGSILAFLPGQGEIRRTEQRLADRLALAGLGDGISNAAQILEITDIDGDCALGPMKLHRHSRFQPISELFGDLVSRGILRWIPRSGSPGWFPRRG